MTAALAALLALSACEGLIGDNGEPAPYQVRRFTCDQAKTPATLPLRRLSKVQYLHTVGDLVHGTPLPATEQAAVLAALGPGLSQFPDDRLVGVPGERHGGFTRDDQALQQAHIDASYAVAVALGAQLTSTPARVTAVVGACATDADASNDAACLRAFVARFGARALRRPLTSEEAGFYAGVAGPTPVDPPALADVVGVLLTAPQFLYHVEEGDPAAPGPVELDASALAARLSYHFWQTMPDQALLDAAQSGALATPEGFRAQVERLYADPRTDASLDEFFGQWFRLDELPPLDTRVGTPVFDAFAGGDVPGASLHTEMNREVLDLARSVARGAGPVSELLTSRRFFARTEGLARLYGQSRWDGVSAPVEFSGPERVGLLTRAAFLASGSANTRPVMKGYRIRNALLCAKIPPPPANAMAVPIELSPDFTTREVVEALTEQPGTSCVGCHSSQLNPLGFATEDFDALGRSRTAQTLYDADGGVRTTKPVSTAAAPFVAGVTTPLAGAGELTSLLASSGDFETCFVRQYFRFTFQRVEDEEADGCTLASLQEAALAGQSTAELLKAAALRPEFKQRDLR